MSGNLADLLLIAIGIVVVVFHKSIHSLMMQANRRMYPRAGKVMEDHTPPGALIIPGVGFIVFGVVLMLNG